MNSIQIDSTLSQMRLKPRTRTIQERSVPKFLKKIYSILQDRKFNEFISWTEDGTAMVIKKPTDFAERILPNFFKHGNFSSFIRQLNLYKFKKSKNSYYDHIYSHDMFKRGKIDLLRNIQRKSAEVASELPVDSQAFKTEGDIDVNRLMQENIHYKKVHKELAQHVEYIENKMKDIKSEISRLYQEQQSSEANEKFLKSVVKSLTKAYGFENISRIIENDVEVEQVEQVSNSPVESTLFTQDVNNEVNSLANNQSSSQGQGINFDEDESNEKYSQFTPDYHYSEHFSTNDTPQASENVNYSCNQDDQLAKQACLVLDLGFSNNFISSEDCVVPSISPFMSRNNSYRIWGNDAKNKDNGSGYLFSNSIECFNLEDF